MPLNTPRVGRVNVGWVDHSETAQTGDHYGNISALGP